MKALITLAIALIITGCAEITPVVTEHETDHLLCGVVETEFSNQPAIHCVKK